MSRRFGTELVLDLHDCNPETIRSAKKIKEFAKKLCKVIDMKPYGDPIVKHFGHDCPYTSGYSLVQMIETSLISGHFSELWNSAYINIFSCKPYDTHTAEMFARRFFGGRTGNCNVIERE